MQIMLTVYDECLIHRSKIESIIVLNSKYASAVSLSKRVPNFHFGTSVQLENRDLETLHEIFSL